MSEQLMQNSADDELELNTQVADSENMERYLTFVSDRLIYAVSTNYVIEILTSPTITLLPMVPDFISGIINLRGQVIPIVDIRRRMGKMPSDNLNNACVIVLNIDSINLGILVDSVSQVLDIDKTKISPMPANNHQELVNGMLSSAEEEDVVLFLDCNLLVYNE